MYRVKTILSTGTVQLIWSRSTRQVQRWEFWQHVRLYVKSQQKMNNAILIESAVTAAPARVGPSRCTPSARASVSRGAPALPGSPWMIQALKSFF